MHQSGKGSGKAGRHGITRRQNGAAGGSVVRGSGGRQGAERRTTQATHANHLDHDEILVARALEMISGRFFWKQCLKVFTIGLMLGAVVMAAACNMLK